MQQAAWLVTLFVSVIVILVFLFVVKNSGNRDEDYQVIKTKGYKIRNIYFVVLIVVLLGAIVFTVQDLPYEKPKGLAAEPISVNVTGKQFAWDMSQTEFKVNQPYAFHVTSADVNHGFGIYDKNMNVLTQTQAMPEYTNTVYFQFDKPGTYQILCLEYCGVAHHLMIKEIKVTE